MEFEEVALLESFKTEEIIIIVSLKVNFSLDDFLILLDDVVNVFGN